MVRLRAPNQKHERYFCTWSSTFLVLPALRLPPLSPPLPMVSFVSLPCRAEHFSIVVAAATDLFAVLSAILPTFLLSAPSPKTERIHSHARTDAHKHIHRRVYTGALAYKLLFSETRREQQERKDNVPRSGVAGAVRYGKTQERRMGAGTERFEREGAYVLSSCR